MNRCSFSVWLPFYIREEGKSMTTLITERLILRQWRESDSEPFATMNADTRVMKYFPSPYTKSDFTYL